MIVRRSALELEKLRRSGLLVYRILEDLKAMVAEGVTTRDLELAAEKMISDAGAKPAFKGYYSQAAGTRFPFVLCTSVNDEVVHGMPSPKRKLKAGDIVSLDTGVQLNGYYGDSAVTIAVGEVNDSVKRLLKITAESLELAIDRVRAGNRLFDICGTVEKHVTANGFSVVREFVGHGIGTSLHEEPQIPNYVDRRSENPRLKPGMVLAIEPMVNAGKPDTKVLSDKWTAVAKDGSYSAHFEHMVAVTENGPWVLSRPHDECRTRRKCQDRHEDEHEAGVQHEITVGILQSESNTERLNHRERDRQITRPLRDLAPSQLAFFLQLVERRDDHSEQLKDDGRRDVRSDAQRENRHAPQHASAKQVEVAQEPAGRVLSEKRLEPVGVDTRCRDVGADAVDREQR